MVFLSSIELFVIGMIVFFAFLVYSLVRLYLLLYEVKKLKQTVLNLLVLRTQNLPPHESSTTAHSNIKANETLQSIVKPNNSMKANDSLQNIQKFPPPLTPKPGNGVQDLRENGNNLVEKMRKLSLLPPVELNGEYALGTWWAARISGILALTAVVFFGIWVNLHSTILPIIRIFELVLLGGVIFWCGQRLVAKKMDISQVLSATGLAVWQFAAWATYGLERMRIFDNVTFAFILQLLVATLIAAFALWRKNKLFGHLAVIFSVISVYMTIAIDVEVWSTVIGVWLVAFIGVILLVCGKWGSVGVLSLIGSQGCLLFLYNSMSSSITSYLPLQLTAFGSLIAFWIGVSLVKDDNILYGRNFRTAFQLACFFVPSLLSLLFENGEVFERAKVSIIIAILAIIASFAERNRNRVVSEVLLISATGFAAASIAWIIDQHLVWLIWVLASATALIISYRTGSEFARWSTELFACVASISFLVQPPIEPWMMLAGIVTLGLLLAFRNDGKLISNWQKFRQIISIFGLATVVLGVQIDFTKVDTGWPWITLLLISAFRFRPSLIWASAAGIVFTIFHVVFLFPISRNIQSFSELNWYIFWSFILICLSSFGIWRLNGMEGSGSKLIRNALAFVTGIVVFSLVSVLNIYLYISERSKVEETLIIENSAWQMTLVWFGGSFFLVGITAFWRWLGAIPCELYSATFGAVLGFLIQSIDGSNYFTNVFELSLIQSPFILLGLVGMLYLLAIHTCGLGKLGTLQRSLLGFTILFVFVFTMLSSFPGAGVSLFWALASMITFVLGHIHSTRTFRMLGLGGLSISVARVINHDVTDILGRIVACGVMALAFFGIAWIYGHIRNRNNDA